MHNWEEGSLRRWVFCIFITNKWNLQFSPMIFFHSRGVLTIYRYADKKDKNKMLNFKFFVVVSLSRAFFPCPSKKCWKWDGTSCQFMWIIFWNLKILSNRFQEFSERRQKSLSKVPLQIIRSDISISKIIQ